MRTTALLAAALAALGLAAPQETGASRFALATVADGRGRPLLDVTADDFAVQEGDAPRDILSVRPADYPLAIIEASAPDETGSPGALADLHAAAIHLVERLGAERAVAIVGSAPPRVIAALTDERRAVLDAVGGAHLEQSNPPDVVGAVSLAVRTLHGTGTLFAAVIVMADCVGPIDRDALTSALGPIVDTGTMVHVVERARPAEARAGAERAKADRAGVTGGSDAADSSPGAARSALQEISAQTRGEYARIFSSASYRAALDHLADRLVSELMIEYLVPVGSKPYDVKIGVKLPGARVRGLGVAPR